MAVSTQTHRMKGPQSGQGFLAIITAVVNPIQDASQLFLKKVTLYVGKVYDQQPVPSTRKEHWVCHITPPRPRVGDLEQLTLECTKIMGWTHKSLRSR
jgi:hypothetical protein